VCGWVGAGVVCARAYVCMYVVMWV
jgi:hypothetical protein